MKTPQILPALCLAVSLPTTLIAQGEPGLPTAGLEVSPNLPPSTDQTLLADSPPIYAQGKLAAAERYLADHLHEAMDPLPDSDYEKLHTRISALRDPETQFGSYIFGLKKPAADVLTNDQIATIDELIEKKNASPINWHDARNTARMQGLITLWAYATESDEDNAAELKKIWEQWNDLRLAYMFQEFIAKEQFQRMVWAVLTPEQKTQLIAGEYDEHIKKNTGHARSFTAAKRVLKEFGEPDHPEEFATVAEKWEAKWQDVVDAHNPAAKFARQRELAMDEADERFARMARKEVQDAFNLFAHAERDAIRELVLAGYNVTPELAKRSAAYRAELRAQMLEKYREHAGDLLRMMGEI